LHIVDLTNMGGKMYVDAKNLIFNGKVLLMMAPR